MPTLEVPEAMQNQRLNVAAQWKPEVTFSGFPRPDITWERNGQSLVSDSKCKIFVDEKTTTIAIYSLERSDTATYIVRAANVAGSACAQLSLTVIGESVHFLTICLQLMMTSQSLQESSDLHCILLEAHVPPSLIYVVSRLS